ncbi:hypothetical protein NEHOM01_2397 [Nematocida homosporus]|uniref:uncharacterized protein n=1 Tax=Nematocida homosporus TaxID=1912981 RepID=UPI00221FAD4B|nr:uncharacterized protein NEHOM01_2397 [Nematocida homosporus]KAI5187833.1 hypothetical protein NEHOM01_2397 [Nematocida homosporus]
MSITEPTSDMQKFIWPLATHLPISYLEISSPQLDKIDFLNDVNWIDRFTLILYIDYQASITINLGERTTKGKDFPSCASLCIDTEPRDQGQEPINCLGVRVTNLAKYLQPNSSDKDDKLLNTETKLTDDILVLQYP